MVDLDAFIKETTKASEAAFEGEKRILSFRQFLDAFAEQRVHMGRNAAQYLLDCFDHYGTEQVDGIGGKVTRFKLFDAPQELGFEPTSPLLVNLFSRQTHSATLPLFH